MKPEQNSIVNNKVINKMEEKKITSVEVFNQIHHLEKEDFVNFNPLVGKSDFKGMSVPFVRLDEYRIRTLNVMIYFVISVQKNANVFQGDSYGDHYRALCAKQISDYYIRNHFIIEEYQFSYLTSKALSNKIEECAHIIFYLIYGRFASHPYINALCAAKNHSSSVKKRPIRRENTIKKRTFKIQNLDNSGEIDGFKRDLKTALSADNLNMAISKNIKASKQQNMTLPNQENQKNLTMSVTQRQQQLTRGGSLNSFIPHRVTEGERSLIFENLAQDGKCYQTLNSWSRKGVMRKQRFNQFFDINELKIKTKLKQNPFVHQENKQNFTKNVFLLKRDSQQLNKINYENFKRISNGLKNKSATLDKIRGECFPRGHKFTFEKQTNETLQETLQRLSEFESQRSKDFILMSRQNKLNLGHKNSKDLQNYHLNIPQYSQQLSTNNQTGVLKKQSMKSQRRLEYFMPTQEDEDQKQGGFATNILRNEESNQLDEDGKKSEYFVKTGVGFKRVDNKSKLHRYKSDYRRFLNTQTLDRIKQA